MQKLRWAVFAFLLAAPAAALAQQQQGNTRDPDLSRAHSLVEKKRYDAALAIYESLLRSEPGNRDAALGRAATLGLAGRLTDALQAYEQWLDANPGDAGAVVYIAQTLAVAGRLNQAERLYRALAAAGWPEGRQGLADIAAQRAGEQPSKRAALPQPRQVATAEPPAKRAAGQQPRHVDSARRYHFEPVAGGTDDTDGNRMRMVGGTAAFTTPWGGELAADARHRAATHDPTGLIAWSSRASLVASQKAGPLAVRVSVGATRLADASATPIVPTRDLLTVAGSASAKLGPLRVAGGVDQGPFDETAPLMLSGIISTAVTGSLALDLGLGFALSTEFEQAKLTKATPNTRIGGAASLSWRAPTIRSLASISLATTVRGFGYEVDPGEGYFAPRQYFLGETSMRITVGRDLGLSVMLDGGVGAQSIDVRVLESPLRPFPRGELSIRYRPTSALEFNVSGTTTSAASPATVQLNDYRATGVRLRTRVSF